MIKKKNKTETKKQSWKSNIKIRFSEVNQNIRELLKLQSKPLTNEEPGELD